MWSLSDASGFLWEKKNKVVQYRASSCLNAFAATQHQFWYDLCSNIEWYYISLTDWLLKKGFMHLIDIVIAYFFESMDANINAKFPDRHKISSMNENNNWNIYKLLNYKNHYMVLSNLDVCGIIVHEISFWSMEM